jgi:hypothetical protein
MKTVTATDRWADLHQYLPTQWDVLEPLTDEMRAGPGMSLAMERVEPRPVMYAEDLRVLAAFARQLMPNGNGMAVETGSYTGSSAVTLLRAGGVPTVFSIDDYSYEFTRNRGPGCGIRSPEDHGRILWLHGKGTDVLSAIWAQMMPLERPWIFFHDSDHGYENVLAELRLAAKLGASGIACHDVRDWPEEGTDRAWREWVAESGWESYVHSNIGIAYRPASDPPPKAVVDHPPPPRSRSRFPKRRAVTLDEAHGGR